MDKNHEHNYPLLKKIASVILPFFIRISIHFIYFTCKKRYIFPSEKIPSPAVLVAWHGQIIMLGYLYKKICLDIAKMHVIVSEHLDGDVAIRVFKNYVDLGYIRGSSRRGAVKALKSAINKLEVGENVGITPDGPKGPLHSVSDGAITLALKCNVPIIAIGWKASKYWQVKSWDETRIPKPFSTITYTINEPIYINEHQNKDEAKSLIKDAIMSCMS